MPKSSTNPRPVQVEVVIVDDSPPGVFRMSSDPKSNGIPITQEFVLTFDNNQGGHYSPGFEVSFNLPADQGKNASWVFDDKDPVWAKLLDNKGACPGNKNQSDPSILSSPTVTNGNRTLTVINDNTSKQFFGFALRFKSAGTGTGKGLTYDPIGDNQNGNALD